MSNYQFPRLTDSAGNWSLDIRHWTFPTYSPTHHSLRHMLPDWLRRDNRKLSLSSFMAQGGTSPAMIATHEVAVNQTEDSVLARCRAGDLDAYGQVYAEHERHVFRYAYHLLRHSEDADDVKQETFMRAFQAISGFRSECSLRTWLLRICANLCRERMKAR